MWAALSALADQYRRANPKLTLAQARADAFIDLMLGNAQVSTDVTISRYGSSRRGTSAARSPSSLTGDRRLEPDRRRALQVVT
jgi:hypothetical protein